MFNLRIKKKIMVNHGNTKHSFLAPKMFGHVGRLERENDILYLSTTFLIFLRLARTR